MKKLLVTGFDPFGGECLNPSWEAVKRLPERIGEWKLTRIEVPTIYGLAAEKTLEAAAILIPDAILCVGQAGGRKAVTPEVLGINLREASIADNAGVLCADEPILPNGENAYFSTFPVRDMVVAIKREGIPSALSYSAGAFVCNDLLYILLHAYQGSDVQVGFIHVPFIPEQTADKKEEAPCMPLDDIVRALTAAIACMK